MLLLRSRSVHAARSLARQKIVPNRYFQSTYVQPRHRSMATSRTYPLAQPKGHKPPVPRWRLQYPADASPVHIVYLGVQRHDNTPSTQAAFHSALDAVQAWLVSVGQPKEAFRMLAGDDDSNTTVWVCYWEDAVSYANDLARLNLMEIYANAQRSPTVGLWCERFTTPISLLETNYTGTDYLPGLAQLSQGAPVEHALTAYWGAARDRIPGSGEDTFARADPEVSRYPEPAPRGVGQRLVGSNPYDNVVHIRSGQFWERCDAEETESYETLLEPTLKTGLQYLWDNRDESGAIGLRFLRNDHGGDREAKETCAAGFFRNLADLEKWSKRHPSHLAIFNGAMRHAKIFGAERKFRTWHEVSILKKGAAGFEYVNCLPETGVIRYLALESQDI